jgi:hypothetical protein
MRKADIACAAVLGAVGILVIADSIRLGNGWGMEGPQAGFFPFLLGSIVVACSLIIIWRAATRRGIAGTGKPFIPAGAWKSVLWVVVPAGLMVVLTEIVGLYIAAAIYLLAYIRWVGGHGWKAALPISLLVPFVFYLLFDRIFLIPMPRGVLDRLLGY